MLGHAYIPTTVLDRRLDKEIRNNKRSAGKKWELEKHLNRRLTILEKAELFFREAPTDVSNPLQQLLKVWRE